MTLRRVISWGLVAVPLLFAALFGWYETTRDPAEQEFVAERDAPVESAPSGPAEEPVEEPAEEPAEAEPRSPAPEAETPATGDAPPTPEDEGAATGPAEEPAGEEPATKPAEPGPSGEEATGAAEEEGPTGKEARGDEEASPPGREDEGAADSEPRPPAPAAGDAPPDPEDEGATTPEPQSSAPGAETPAAGEEVAAALPGAGAGSPDPDLDEEAADYVAKLAKPAPEPIPGERAAHFIGADQEIRFGSAEEDPPLGSVAAVANPDDPLRVPSAEDDGRGPREDAGPSVETTGPAAARAGPSKRAAVDGMADAEAAAAGEGAPDAPGQAPPKKPVEDTAASGSSAPGPEREAPGEDAATVRAAEPTRKADGDAGEPASGTEPPAPGKDGTTARSRTPAREGVSGPEREAPGEDAATARPAEPMRKADDDAGEPASGTEPPASGKDGTTARSRTPARRPAEHDAAGAASPARKGVSEPERKAPGEGAATARAVEPMRKADDDVGELVSGTEPPASGKDGTTAGSIERPPESAAEPAAEPASDPGPAAAGKDEAAAAGTAAEVRGPGETPAPRKTITIRELLRGTVEVGEHDIFYVHAVTPNDHQGLWGIIQQAVAENFARGVRITLGERTDTYRVTVPENADELLDDRSSSPLGLMIHRKSRETIVYNRGVGRLTQDPDVTLYPGNEIIIVGFEPGELIRLYKHFANADGG